MSEAVLAFVERVVASPADLPHACQEFGSSRYSKGLQAAFLSPILNALRPELFLILNTKSFCTLAYLRGTTYSRRITEYPRANEALLALQQELEADLRRVAPEGAHVCDVLDQFCHWLVALKKVAGPKRRLGKPASPIDRAGPDGPLDPGDPSSADRLVARFFPDEAAREGCLRFLADAIEQVHRHGAARWNVRLSKGSIRLRAGRLVALELRKDAVRLGLALQSADDRIRALPGKRNPGADERAELHDVSVKDFLSLEASLRAPFNAFLAAAAATRARVVGAHTYSAGVLLLLEKELGRALPRPAHATEQGVQPRGMVRAVAIKTPRTVFKKVDYDLAALLSYIDNEDIGLPDIQRPFVWTAAKVRDLFDSMYRGFPVGYLLFWENSEIQGTKAIGLGPKRGKVARLLIVDGQQRLTSLFAVMRGREVLDSRFRPTRLEIGFRPRDGRFEVSDAAIRQDPEFIPDVAKLWTDGKSSYGFVNEFLKGLRTKRELTAEDEEAIGHNLDRLFDLQKYPFTAVEITPQVDEEAVSDIFVRINSEGVKLQQADFILTLLSVFWDQGRTALERFSRAATEPPGRGGGPSPFNYLIQPTPSQLLKVSIAVGFHRARLRSVYQVLRGKDLETGQPRWTPKSGH